MNLLDFDNIWLPKNFLVHLDSSIKEEMIEHILNFGDLLMSICGIENCVLRMAGSCWAHAALSSLADRHKIFRKAQWPDIHYSVQV